MASESSNKSYCCQITIGEQAQNIDYKNIKEVYEVIRVENKVPVFLDDHMHRLNNSFKRLNISNIFYPEQLTKAIQQFIINDQIINNNIRVSCLLSPDNSCNYYIYRVKSSYPASLMYKNGVDTILLHAERKNPNIKIGHTQVRETANKEILERHVFESLLVNHDEEITEGSRSNVFFVQNNQIITAPDNSVLQGIIRSKVIEICQQNNLPLIYKCLPIGELKDVQAAFITGTSSRVLPLRSIDNLALSTDHPYIIQLKELLKQKVQHYIQNETNKLSK